MFSFRIWMISAFVYEKFVLAYIFWIVIIKRWYMSAHLQSVSKYSDFVIEHGCIFLLDEWAYVFLLFVIHDEHLWNVWTHYYWCSLPAIINHFYSLPYKQTTAQFSLISALASLLFAPWGAWLSLRCHSQLSAWISTHVVLSASRDLYIGCLSQRYT